MSILNALIGAALLFFGRKFFWLFAAGFGFVAGLSLTGRLFQNAPQWLLLVLALGLGLLGALLAVFFQRVAIGVAGFLAGGYLMFSLVTALGLEQGYLALLAFAIGGLLGIILVSLLFDWTLIALSSLAGAALIVGAFNFPREAGLLAFVVLLVLGISVQTRVMKAQRGRGKE